MTDARKGGIALIAGAVGTLVTMAFHPSGHELRTAGERFGGMASLTAGVHALAIASLAVLFLGALALTQRLAASDRLATAALVAYGMALVAGLGAATVSGFVAPGLVRELATAEPDAAEAWRLLLGYNWRLNQAAATILVMASAVAIALWSAAIVRERALARGIGLYGLLLGAVLVVAVASGHQTLDVHGFGLVTLGQAVWFVGMGVFLWQSEQG